MAATVSLIQMLAAGCANSDGTPIASGRARFYQPATLTPVTVYSDAAGTTAISPPLILTAGGTGIAYTQQPTRMLVKDATDTNTLIDANVNTTRAESEYISNAAINGGTETTLNAVMTGIGTSFGGTAGLFKYKAASNATEQLVKDVITALSVSVKSFGAVGDGVTDDSTAIQAAVTFAALTGGIVYFPPGTYLFGTTISVTTAGTNIRGAGMGVSMLKYSGAGDALAFSIASGSTASRTSVYGVGFTHATTTTGAAISATGAFSGLSIDQVYVAASSYRYCIQFNAATSNSVNACILTANSGDASSIAIDVTAGATILMSLSTARSGAVAGLRLGSSAQFLSVGSFISASGAAGNGVAISSTGQFYGSANNITGGASGSAISTGTSGFVSAPSSTNSLSPSVLDARTAAAPIAYSVSSSSAVLPLPLLTDTVRIVATTGGITVTISPTAVVAHGATLTLMCGNSSGGAVTWTFDAQYKTSAAVAPADTFMVVVTFKYDIVSSKWREACRVTVSV